MGIGQWTRLVITSDSVFCNKHNIKPGEYLFMYDTSASKLLIRDNKQRIVYEKNASSLRDLVSVLASSVPNTTDLEVIKNLERGGKSGTKAFPNHHIIPVHIWKDSQLVIEAKRHGFDMNGEDNLMPLPFEVHKKSHKEDSGYSQTVRYYLRDRWNALVEADLDNDPDEIRDALISLIEALRENLNDIVKEGGYMDDIYHEI